MLRRSADDGASLSSILRGFWPFLPLVAGLGLLASLADGAGIALFIPLLSILLSDQGAASLPAPLGTALMLFHGYDLRVRVILLGGTIFVLILLKAIIQATNAWLAASVQGRMGRRIREGLAEALLTVDYPFFLRADHNRLSHILAADSWFVIDALQWILTLIPAVAGLVVLGGLLAWLNVKLFLIVLVGAVAMQATLNLFEKRQERLSFEFTARNQLMWKRLSTLTQAPRVIRLFGQQQREEQRTSEAIDRLRRTVVAGQAIKAFVSPAADVMAALICLTVLIIGYRGGMSIPAITVFVLLLTRAQPHAKTATSARFSIVSLRSSFGEVEWLLSQQTSAPKPLGQSGNLWIDGDIHFDEVSYAYPDGSRVLDRLTATISTGTTIAVLGESGSGKTTFVNVLCRLLEPQSGDIRMGSESIRNFDPESWRKRVAVAGQDSELIAGTVFENIAYARPDASLADVAELARVAGADEFITTLPQGYDTILGPNGFSLSGGQRQRIGLARALSMAPDILILDEATNAIDAATEAEIMIRIGQGSFCRTMIVISHRKLTLSRCQQGIVLDKGRVSQAGALGDLPYYYEMAGDRS